MEISDYQFMEASGIKQRMGLFNNDILFGLKDIPRSINASKFLDLFIVGPYRPYSDVDYDSFVEYSTNNEDNKAQPFIDFASQPEVFKFLSQLDHGGLPTASLTENWSLNEVFTAGSLAIGRPYGHLSSVDVRKWASLDGKSGLSLRDNNIAKDLMKYGNIT